MRTISRKLTSAGLLLLVLCTSLPGQSLPLPRSVCKLSIEGFTDFVESYPMQRVFFDGCLEMQGDPARLFYLDGNPAPDCAIQFYYDWDPEIKLQIRVYKDDGATRFNDTAWNTLILEGLQGMRDVEGELIQAFDGEAASGTPMLGYVAMDCTVRLTAKKTDAITLHRYCLVPVPEKSLVLMVGFFSSEKHFGLINSEFERFVRGLHRRP